VGAAKTILITTDSDASDKFEVPEALVAVTLNRSTVPFERPETTMGLRVPVAIVPSGYAVTV
jgi:hypothetical protein